MVVEKGYAKINLGLEVVKKRDDGYHDLSMIMTAVELYDELYFEEDPLSKQVKIDCDKLSHIALEDNLIYKAVMLLKNDYHIEKGLKIKVVKRIPEQAGLAGGSADAAATLRGLNKLWNLNLSLDELALKGFKLGSDIPFCIYNQAALASKRGEEIEFIDDIPFAYVLLIIPPYGNSTQEIFKNFVIHKNNLGKIALLQAEIKQGNINAIAKDVFNDLEVGPKQNEINKIKQSFLQAGALGCSMTGSGSAVYGLFFNEKQAKNAEAKLRSKYDKQNYQIIFTQIRSQRKPNLEGFVWIPQPKKPQVLMSKEVKVSGYVTLGYYRVWEHYRMIAAPVSFQNTITLQKLSSPVCEVKYGEVSSKDDLYANINKIVEKVGFGLRVVINEKNPSNLSLITSDQYLSAIITALDSFGVNPEGVFALFPQNIEAYAHEQTFEYDSKTNQIFWLGDAIFGFVLVVSLDLKGYISPRYTPQAEAKTNEFEAIKKGIQSHNFYEMAGNVYNGISSFEKRAIQEFRHFAIIDKAKELSLRLGASGVLLSPDNPKLLCFCRFKNQAETIGRNLQRKYRLNNFYITSIKSSLKHEPIVSFTLEESSIKETIRYSLEQYLRQEEMKSHDGQNNPTFEEKSYQEGSPFENDDGESISEDVPKTKSAYRKAVKPAQRTTETDIEGILYLHSGGSLFKQYDFVDIARYFQKYFHGKAININKEGEIVKVIFFTSSLPHILGIHLLDENDMSLRGALGFNRLINGEISYYQLKKSGRYSDTIIKKIYNKTQSSVLIFNDIYNNRPLSCFDKNLVKNENSKMETLEFAVTRRLTETTFHRQNLLGIGKDPKTNTYFFNTSFLWEVPADVGKKDSLKIEIQNSTLKH